MLWEYRVVKPPADDRKLEALLNTGAQDGWQPLVGSDGGVISVVLRRCAKCHGTGRIVTSETKSGVWTNRCPSGCAE